MTDFDIFFKIDAMWIHFKCDNQQTHTRTHAHTIVCKMIWTKQKIFAFYVRHRVTDYFHLCITLYIHKLGMESVGCVDFDQLVCRKAPPKKNETHIPCTEWRISRCDNDFYVVSPRTTKHSCPFWLAFHIRLFCCRSFRFIYMHSRSTETHIRFGSSSLFFVVFSIWMCRCFHLDLRFWSCVLICIYI